MYIQAESGILIQGITGRQGSYHASRMKEEGFRVVAGVTPGKGSRTLAGVPVYDTVAQAAARHRLDVSMIIVPPPFVLAAAREAFEAGLKLVVIITEHVPVADTMRIRTLAGRHGAELIGPNTIGLIRPGLAKVGIMPTSLYGSGGPVAIISRSGTLSHENASNLVNAGVGVGLVVGIGGDPIIGQDFLAVLERIRDEESIGAVLLIGEIGQDREERAAAYIQQTAYPKPVFAFIAGRHAPPGKKMGHAGAIIEKGAGSAAGKKAAFEAAGVRVCPSLQAVVDDLKAWQAAQA